MFDLAKFLASGPGTKVMGIVNATGDSFSEGAASSPDSAPERAEKLLLEGADLLDIGGESTRPGAGEVPAAEETARVLPVIRELRRSFPDAVLSIDTRHGETAQAALEEGVQIVNDVSMLRDAPEIAAYAARCGAALILSHSRGTSGTMRSEAFCRYEHGVVADVAAELRAAEARAAAAGLPNTQILLDPGIGFAKTPEQCWELVRNPEKIASPRRLLYGVSRKSFLGELTGEAEPRMRGGATLGTELYLASRGVAILRTHAVKELKQALLAMAKIGNPEVRHAE